MNLPQGQQLLAPVTAKPTPILTQTTSAIPGLTIPGILEKQTLPALNIPRKNQNLSVPQNFHTYKSQSESPFQARNKPSGHKSIAGSNQVILDKIDETTQVGAKIKPNAQRQNRSISPRINEKAQLKNTLNSQSQRPNISRPSKQNGASTPLRNPPQLSQTQRLKMQTSEAKTQDKPFMLVSPSQGLSSTLKSNSSNSNQQQLPLQPLAVIPEQQKSMLQNQRLQGSQVTLIPKNYPLSANPIQQQQGELKPIVKKTIISNVGSPLISSQDINIVTNNNNNNNNFQLRFYIGKGNNSERIRKLLSKREGWVETMDPTTVFAHFKWQQTNRGYKYDKLVENNYYKQVVNHFEYHKEISNKQYLVKNLMSFAESMKQNVFDMTPLTYVIDFNDDNCDLILNNFLKFFEMNMPLYLKKKQTNLQAKGNDIRKIFRSFQNIYEQSKTEKLFNYFYTRWALQDTFLDQENSTYMWLLKPTFMNRGRGIHVFNSLASLEKLMSDYTEGFEEKSLKKSEDKQNEEFNGNEPSPSVNEKKNMLNLSQNNLPPSEEPLTLQRGSLSVQKSPDEVEKQEVDPNNETQQQKDKENQQLQQQQSVGSPEVKRISQNGNSFQIKKIKPLQSVQRVISMTSSMPASTSSSKQTKKEEPKPKGASGPFILKASQFVVQKYIEKPLLIQNRKFDIRVWALVSHTFDVYYFREGYIRLSSSEFSTDESQLDNLFIHLTNNAIQKYSDNYGQFENGNMWSFGDLWTFLEAHYENSSMPELEKQPAKFYKKKIVSKIKDVIWLTFCSVKKKLNQHDRKYCFEMFGFDFLVDANLNTWLIEVNTNPAIEECSKITQTLVPRALDDAFKITIDQIFAKRLNNNNNNNNNTTPNNTNNNGNANQTIVQKDKSPPQKEGDNEIKPQVQNETIEDNEEEEIEDPPEDQQPQEQNQKNSQGVSNQIKKEEEPEFFPVFGYQDDANMWEMLGNLKDSSNVQVKKKFKQMK